MYNEAKSQLSLNEMSKEAHATSTKSGWWEDATWNLPEKLALMHSELSEALEDYRVVGLSPELSKHIYEDKLTGEKTTSLHDAEGRLNKPVGFVSELADVVIRIGDLCGKLEIDLGRAVSEKMAFNKTRSHRHGGKVA